MNDAARARRLDAGPLPWLVAGLIAAAVIMLRTRFPAIQAYPEKWIVPIAKWINPISDWVVATFQKPARMLTAGIEVPLKGLQELFAWLPWLTVVALVTVLAHKAGGRRLAVLTFLIFMYIVVTGHWSKSMNSLSLVLISVPLSATIGFALGVLGHRSEVANRIIQPALDFMQTIPAFAYLIPILLLFGFGPVVGLLAGVIYAIPPMVRNTILGLNRVPSAVLESGLMSGCTPRQKFWWTEVPTAAGQIMIGLNQTTMAAFSMIIVASVIGGFDDIGWEVLSTLRKAHFGQALLSGLVIALLAIAMDDITAGFVEREGQVHPPRGAGWRRYRHLIWAIVALASTLLLAHVFPALGLTKYPRAWVYYPADPINEALSYVVKNWSDAFVHIRNTGLFYLLLPLRIGLQKAISPYSWGFALTPSIIWSYALGVMVVAALLFWKYGWRPAVALLVAAGLLYFGTEGTPWIILMLVITLLAYQTGGFRLAMFCLASLAFMLVTGVWKPAMGSLSLCTAAVVLCFVIGSSFGVWASRSDRVSAALKPINATLQTMPQFVLLIPVVLLFQIGEFSALLAIMFYAIVPSMLYTEHGLRNVPPTLIEAAQSMGCTKWQMFWEVEFPYALPEIVLGLNQTIMFALSMLVIAALVGTTELGQQIYVALGKADPGQGLVTGLSMALIAMMADRIIQSWTRRKRAALGLA